MHRQEAVSNSLRALLAGKVEEAVAITGNYYGGAGTLYERETIGIIEGILRDDYSPDPALKPKVLESLRIVAAATELWGASELQEFANVSGDWTYRYKPEEVIALLHTAGLERHRLARLQADGVTRVVIRVRSGLPGLACRPTAGRVFPIGEAPNLPHPDPACRCSYAVAPPAADDPAPEEGT